MMVSIIALSFCLLNTQKVYTRNWTKTNFWEADLLPLPSYIQTFMLDMMDNQTSLIFSTAAPPFALTRDYTTEQGASTCELELFSSPFLAELTFKHISSEPGVHTTPG